MSEHKDTHTGPIALLGPLVSWSLTSLFKLGPLKLLVKCVACGAVIVADGTEYTVYSQLCEREGCLKRKGEAGWTVV